MRILCSVIFALLIVFLGSTKIEAQSFNTMIFGQKNIAEVNNPPYQSSFRVTGIYIDKSDKKLYLLNGRKVLKSYDVELGFNPVGHKRFQGDGKTPEGVYYIDRKNPQSQFHLSLGLSYPNSKDKSYAQKYGKSAGGDIFIHGKKGLTRGCISVSNRDIEEIYKLVEYRTPVQIVP